MINNIWSRHSLAPLAVISVAVLSACSEPSPSSLATPSAQSTTVVHHASLADAYSTVNDLSTASSLIVAGTAGTSHVEKVGEVPFTVTDFKVTDLTKAPSSIVSGSTIQVRQSPGSVSPADSPASDEDAGLAGLTSGTQYLLYLQPFTFSDTAHAVPNEYVITGGQAAWEKTSTHSYIQKLSSKLPTTLSIEGSGKTARISIVK